MQHNMIFVQQRWLHVILLSCRHRYSCSEQSDADSNSQLATGDEYQQDVDDLEAIHSVGQSLEDPAIRKLLASSSTGYSVSRQHQAEAFDTVMPEFQQQWMLARSSGGYGRPSLTPVKEEQPDEQVGVTVASKATAHTMQCSFACCNAVKKNLAGPHETT